MTSYILPLVLVSILVLSFGKTEIYNDFISGAGEGIRTVLGIFPAILAILVACAMLRASGAFDIFLKLVSPLTHRFKIPDEIMQLAVVRPLSGGAAIGILSDIIKSSPDSHASLAAAVMTASSETTFYTLSVYFGKTRVKYTKKIIPAAIIGDIVGLLAAVWVCKIIF